MIIKKIYLNSKQIKTIYRAGSIRWTCETLEISATLTGRTLSWNEVEGATKYNIIAYNVAYGEVENQLTTQETSIDLNAYAGDYLTAGCDYTFTVEATTEAETVLCSSNEVAWYYIAAPVISLNGAILSWNAVDKATEYTIGCTNQNVTGAMTDAIPGGSSMFLLATTTETEFDLTTIISDFGEYEIAVVSVHDNGLSTLSNTVTYTYLPQLDTPEIYLETVEDEVTDEATLTATLVENQLSWNAVEGASYYDIFMYDVANDNAWVGGARVIETTVALEDLFLDDYAGDGTEYQVTLTAYDADNNELCGTEVTWVCLEAPVCSVENNYLRWTSVEGAGNYEIDYRTVGSDTWTRKPLAIVPPQLKLSWLSIFASEPSGEYELSVIAINEDGTIFSLRSNIVTYTHA